MSTNLFVVHGDCTAILPQIPDASVDAVVTDPNYGMHEYPLEEVTECIVAWATGQPWTPKPRPGFLNKEWDTWVPGPDVWRECLRVLKPGGHLLSFAAPRTIDLAMLAVRLAGFEIRDEFNWIFGQGYPKSFNVEKALREAGLDEEADRFTDWGTGLKPAHEPVIVARKPLIGTVVENVLAFDTGAINIGATRIPVDTKDTAYAANFAGARGHEDNRTRELDFRMTAGTTPSPGGRWPANVLFDEAAAALLDAQSGVLKSGIMKAGLARHSDGGYKGGFGDVATTYDRGGDSGGASRFFHVVRTGVTEPCASASTAGQNSSLPRKHVGSVVSDAPISEHQDTNQNGSKVRSTTEMRNASRSSDALRTAQTQSTKEKSLRASVPTSTSLNDHANAVDQRTQTDTMRTTTDLLMSGSSVGPVTSSSTLQTSGPGEADCASFRYCAKAPTRERNAGLKDPNPHVTVKPIELMRYLVKLVARPGAMVLDPFCGSGTTGCAAALEGCHFIGIEREEQSVNTARDRIRHWGYPVTEGPIDFTDLEGIP